MISPLLCEKLNIQRRLTVISNIFTYYTVTAKDLKLQTFNYTKEQNRAGKNTLKYPLTLKTIYHAPK